MRKIDTNQSSFKGRSLGEQLLYFLNLMHNRQKQSQKRSAPALERHVAPEPSVPRAAYVQAYESQLVYGQPSRARDICSKEGGSLMQWHGDDDGHREIWADRYV